MSRTLTLAVERTRALRQRFPVGDSRRRTEAFESALDRVASLGSQAEREDFDAVAPALDGLTPERVLRLGGSAEDAAEVEALRETWARLREKSEPRTCRSGRRARAASAEDEE